MKIPNALLNLKELQLLRLAAAWSKIPGTEDMIDHRSYTHNLSSFEIKAWRKIQAWTGFEPTTSAIPVQCFSNWKL